MNYTHLDDAVRPLAALPFEDRIQKLHLPHWIGHTYAKRILDQLEELFQYPSVHRMPNLLIVGESNNGKTVVVRRFQSLHPAKSTSGSDQAIVPVMLLQAPPEPNENRFYSAILEALQAPYTPRGSGAEKQVQVIHLLRVLGVRLLIIDEIHHILAGHLAKQRQFLNVLKYLGNELQIPLVGVGTMDALRAIHSDPQMANRFEPVALPRWRMNRDFQMLLASFERILPLQQPSRLAEPALAARLLALSEGTIGELSSLLVRAAAWAIRSGVECINEDVLLRTEWTPPSVRRRQIEKLI